MMVWNVWWRLEGKKKVGCIAVYVLYWRCVCLDVHVYDLLLFLHAHHK